MSALNVHYFWSSEPYSRTGSLEKEREHRRRRIREWVKQHWPTDSVNETEVYLPETFNRTDGLIEVRQNGDLIANVMYEEIAREPRCLI